VNIRVALLAALLFMLGASVGVGDSVYVYGIVQEEGSYRGVSGGTVRIEHEHQNRWYKERETTNMRSAYFGWYLTKAGNYRIAYEQDGYEVVGIRDAAFTLDTAPTRDILIVVRTAPTVPTETPEPTPSPTVDATRTPRPTATANPAVSYIEISAHIQGALMAYTDVVLREFVPASCFEIAAAERGCPLAVTQSWVARLDGECWRFRPFSCPGGDGIELAARCESPCEVGVIENGYW